MGGLLGKTEKEQIHFDKLAEKQQASWWGHMTYAGKKRQERRAKLVANYLSPENEESRLLEIGCGAGDFSAYLLEELPPCNFFGIDISGGLLEQARSRITSERVIFLQGDVENIDPKYGDFDSVFGASILHHLDVPKSLSEIYKILKPGGKILFMEPNMLNPQIWVEKNIKFIGRLLQNTDDETAFYKWEISKLLQESGFGDISVQPFDFLHPAIPKPFVDFLDSVLGVFERMPLLGEFAGSLMIKARKPV